jgi:excisionase family DNA binding protein
MDSTPRLLHPREAAAYLAISERSVWNLESRGLLKAVRVGRIVRFDREDLDRFIQTAKIGDVIPAVLNKFEACR